MYIVTGLYRGGLSDLVIIPAYTTYQPWTTYVDSNINLRTESLGKIIDRSYTTSICLDVSHRMNSSFHFLEYLPSQIQHLAHIRTPITPAHQLRGLICLCISRHGPNYVGRRAPWPWNKSNAMHLIAVQFPPLGSPRGNLGKE